MSDRRYYPALEIALRLVDAGGVVLVGHVNYEILLVFEKKKSVSFVTRADPHPACAHFLPSPLIKIACLSAIHFPSAQQRLVHRQPERTSSHRLASAAFLPNSVGGPNSIPLFYHHFGVGPCRSTLILSHGHLQTLSVQDFVYT